MSDLFIMLTIILMCIRKSKEEKDIQNEAKRGKMFYCILAMCLLLLTEEIHIFHSISDSLYTRWALAIGIFILLLLLDFRKTDTK